ncbi:MAG: hypothetical protein AB8G05_19235 [Oligoflexales bacterium]
MKIYTESSDLNIFYEYLNTRGYYQREGMQLTGFANKFFGRKNKNVYDEIHDSLPQRNRNPTFEELNNKDEFIVEPASGNTGGAPGLITVKAKLFDETDSEAFSRFYALKFRDSLKNKIDKLGAGDDLYIVRDDLIIFNPKRLINDYLDPGFALNSMTEHLIKRSSAGKKFFPVLESVRYSVNKKKTVSIADLHEIRFDSAENKVVTLSVAAGVTPPVAFKNARVESIPPEFQGRVNGKIVEPDGRINFQYPKVRKQLTADQLESATVFSLARGPFLKQIFGPDYYKIMGRFVNKDGKDERILPTQVYNQWINANVMEHIDSRIKEIGEDKIHGIDAFRKFEELIGGMTARVPEQRPKLAVVKAELEKLLNP